MPGEMLSNRNKRTKSPYAEPDFAYIHKDSYSALELVTVSLLFLLINAQLFCFILWFYYTAKQKQYIGIRVKLELLFNDSRQTVNPTAKIRISAGEVDLRSAEIVQHNLNMRNSAASVVSSAPLCISAQIAKLFADIFIVAHFTSALPLCLGTAAPRAFCQIHPTAK